MSDTLPRPRPVTTAGWVIMVGSVLVVLTVFERMSTMGSLETRETAERMLSETPGTGLGTEGVLRLLEVSAMVAGGCAAATAVLGFHVLRRSRGARMGVTVLALPLFVSGTVTGGFLSSVVAFSTILLWVEPARVWFDGRAPRRTTEVAERAPSPPSLPSPASPPDPAWPPPGPTTPPPVEGPRAHPGFGAAPEAARSYAPQVQTRSPVATGPAAPAPRPPAVLWACVLTWVFSGAMAALMGLSALVVAVAPDLVFDQLQQQRPDVVAEQGLTRGAISGAFLAVSSVAVLWSVVASVLAVLLVRRVSWARVALLASTGGVAAISVIGLLGSGFLLVVPLLGAAVTISLLVRPEVRHWVAAP